VFYVNFANGADAGLASRPILFAVFTASYRQEYPAANSKVCFWRSWPADARVRSRRGNETEFVAPSNAMFRVSDTIRKTQTVDGGVLLDVRHGRMFCLNLVGARILELMQQGCDESRIADEISREYGMSKELVLGHVVDFIKTLHKHHILQPIRSTDVI
jgi:Coenzyme PQQ synthesis protein D (PqqD)